MMTTTVLAMVCTFVTVNMNLGSVFEGAYNRD